MKKGYLFFIFALYNLLASAQQLSPDSIFQYYNNHKQKMELAYSFSTIATAYNSNNNVPQALVYYNKSLKTYQEINDKAGIAKSYFNIGKILNGAGNKKDAFYCHDKRTKIKQQIANELKTANSLNKLADSYHTQLKTKLALSNYYQSLKLYLQINNKTGIVNALNSIGTICIEQGDKNQGLKYYNLSSHINEDCKKRACAKQAEMNNSDRISYSFNHIAAIYLQQQNYALAHAYADSSIHIAKQANYPNSIYKADSLQAEIDLAIANLNTTPTAKKATYLADSKMHQQQFTTIRDSLKAAGNNPTTKQPNTQNQPKSNFTLIKTISIFIFLIGFLLMLVYNSVQKKQK